MSKGTGFDRWRSHLVCAEFNDGGSFARDQFSREQSGGASNRVLAVVGVEGDKGDPDRFPGVTLSGGGAEVARASCPRIGAMAVKGCNKDFHGSLCGFSAFEV